MRHIRKLLFHTLSILNKFLAHFKLQVNYIPCPNFFDALLLKHLKKSKDFFFVQIGANDGINNDPIHEFVTTHNLSGIVVEPLPDIFCKLQENYSNYRNITPVNTAIHSTKKTLTLYRVDPKRLRELPEWADGISSFNKDHHLNSNIPSEYIVKEEVNAVTMKELLTQYNIKKIDLLQIDTEGYDFEIIKMIDFSLYKPKIIRFEHGVSQGTTSFNDLNECVEILYNNGYSIILEKIDGIAYLK